MNFPINSSRTIVPSDYQPFRCYPSFKAIPDHNDHDIPSPLTKTWRDQSARFGSLLAHEVRNPLTNINLSIDMLKSVIMDNELKIYLDIISRSSTRINYLINEILRCQENAELE
jgi:nitrogen-specific signal transduction histidine kinase